MEEKGVGGYVIRIILVFMGSAGILNTVISGGALPVSVPVIYLCVGMFSAVFVICMCTSQIGKFFIRVFGVLFGLFILVTCTKIYQGIRFIINDCIESMRRAYRGLEDRTPKYTDQELLIRPFCETIAFIFLGAVTVLLVSVIVIYIRSMLSALLSVLPLMVLFVGFSAIPDTLSFVCCITYVLGVMALDSGIDTVISVHWVIAGALVTAFLCVAIIPEQSFVRPAVFQKWGKQMRSLTESGKMQGGEANGVKEGRSATNGGELGKLDSVEYKNEPVLRLITEDVGVNQYIAEFHGEQYRDNRWVEAAENIGETSRLFEMMDSNKTLQDYVDGSSGKYSEMVRQYMQLIEYTGYVANKKSTDCFLVQSSCYQKFKDISDKTVLFDVKNGPYTQPEYSRYEEAARTKAYGAYTKVDDSTKNLIRTLLGNMQVKTFEEKLYYIQYVKDYLRDNYTYTKAPGAVPEGNDFVKYFLMDSKEGYCTYFATAAVMMYRTAGIPARYVEGYVVEKNQILQGSQRQRQVYRYTADGVKEGIFVPVYSMEVLDNAAHAWVEIYMDGYGWVTVEATPPVQSGGVFGTGQQILPLQELLTSGEGDLSGEIFTEPETQPETEEITETESVTRTETVEEEQQPTAPEKNSSQIPLNGPLKFSLMDFVAGAACLLMLFAAVCAVRYLYFTRKRRHLLKQGTLYEVYSYMARLLSHTEYKRPDAMDYQTYADFLEKENELFARYHIAEHFDLLLKVRFGREMKVEASDVNDFRRDVAGLRAELIGRMPWGRRIAVKYWRCL